MRHEHALWRVLQRCFESPLSSGIEVALFQLLASGKSSQEPVIAHTASRLSFLTRTSSELNSCADKWLDVYGTLAMTAIHSLGRVQTYLKRSGLRR